MYAGCFASLIFYKPCYKGPEIMKINKELSVVNDLNWNQTLME